MGQDYYYDENGNVVFTENFHLRRGVCCGSGCINCPFDPQHQRGNRKTKMHSFDSDELFIVDD